MAPAETCKIVKVIAQIADLDIQDGSYFGAFGEELATIARDERDARTMLRNIAPEPDCAKFHERLDNAVIGRPGVDECKGIARRSEARHIGEGVECTW